MNGRKKDVLIEDFVYTDPRTGVETVSDLFFYVWADADSKSAMESVEGVTWVHQDSFDKVKFSVHVDKRYDMKHIQREVEAAILCRGDV